MKYWRNVKDEGIARIKTKLFIKLTAKTNSAWSSDSKEQKQKQAIELKPGWWHRNAASRRPLGIPACQLLNSKIAWAGFEGELPTTGAKGVISGHLLEQTSQVPFWEVREFEFPKTSTLLSSCQPTDFTAKKLLFRLFFLIWKATHLSRVSLAKLVLAL